MKLYRVCTENKNYSDILDYLDKHFPDGYTVIHANGAWQGVREKSLVIEIVSDIMSFPRCQYRSVMLLAEKTQQTTSSNGTGI